MLETLKRLREEKEFAAEPISPSGVRVMSAEDEDEEEVEAIDDTSRDHAEL